MKYHLINDKVVLADSLTVEQGQYEFDIRCKFNSQYYGVKVFTLFEGTIVKLTNIDARIALLLREVSDLTDEEHKVIMGSFKVYNAKSALNSLLQGGATWFSYTNAIGINDYLRSIGILLPFTYLNSNKQPITLSTEDIKKLGWAVTK